MPIPVQLISLFAAISIIVLASRQMGTIFARFKFPLISGFLFVGILAGPFILNFVEAEDVPQFLFLDEVSLAFIAFAAGAEIERKVIQGYIRSILALITGQVIAVFAIGMTAFFLIRNVAPFMVGLPMAEVFAIALLGSTIMIARSPSSAIAIIKELRARGPFTHKILGATVLKDAVVIVIFAAAVSIAVVIVEGGSFDAGLLVFVLFEIVLDIALGVGIGLLLHSIMGLPYNLLKMGLILAIGFGVFSLSTILNDFHFFSLPVGIFSEPLLICMTAGFYVTNFSRNATDFQHIVEKMSPAIFLLFFTLVGVELELDVIRESWLIVFYLFAVRLVAIFVGSFAGVTIARDHSPHNSMLGFGFITQAGVSIGLAKEIGLEFGAWGAQLASLSIGAIVINQIVGPPLLKWAINRVGEAHTRAESPAFDGVRDALIFGVESQSRALARQLETHQWTVNLVARDQAAVANGSDGSQRVIKTLPEISVEGLRDLEMQRADGVVLMLSDDENYAISELIYEHFGVDNVIVRLEDRSNLERFHELGATVVDPGTAMVSLLDHFVRTPSAASLLLGLDPDEDVIEIEISNHDLNGLAIRDLHFPHDVLILSVSRGGVRLDSHGYTRLRVGDHVTVVGSAGSLADVQVRFET